MLITEETGSGEFAIKRPGNAVHDRDWRVLDPLVKGLLTLWREGWRVEFMVKDYETLVGP